ncbi:MAG: hypothetical protein HUU47_03955 [Bacteroidetes bacterium]|nr:hypothetical protein [Bacteroidota bacterium]
MKRKILYIFLIAAVNLITARTVFSQKYLIFPENITSNTVLDSGNYLLNGISTVKSGKILMIKDGVNVFFGRNAQIIVNGGVIFEGKKNKLINFTSINPDFPGKGIVVSGADLSSINFNYCSFKFLSKPLHVQKNWLRESVSIKNSIFKFSELYGANVEINEVDNILISKPVKISIENNTFSNNSGSILISEIASDFIQTSIKNNVIIRNEYIGRDRNGMFTSPLFFNYNQSNNTRIPVLENNSIFDNFSNQFLEDSVSVDFTNICVVGNAEKLDVSDNYFGNPENKEIENTFDFVSANFMAPTLYFNQLNETPNQSINGHFYKILLNDQELDELINIKELKSKISNIELDFNRPVKNSDNYDVQYFYIYKDTLVNKELKHKLVWNEENNKLKIEINDNIISREKNGYIYIDGFFDENGMEVPALFIGKKQFLKNNEIEMVITNFLRKIPRKDLFTKRFKTVPKGSSENNLPDDKLSKLIYHYTAADSLKDLNDTVNHTLKTSKFWEAGLFFGNGLYWGDLFTTTVGLTYENFKPAIGIRLKYHLTERFQLNFGANYLEVSGTDDRTKTLGKERGTGYSRGLSFKTKIFDLYAQAEMDLIKYKSIKSYIPSIAIGANVYNFTPYGQYNGRWYKLRPIGTEGQTLPGGKGTYANWMVGIPFTVSVKKHMGIRNVISLSYTYNKIFTDYLDDVSTGNYPDAEALKKANQSLGDIAVKLSNPNDHNGQRSTSGDYDGYGYWGLTWTHKFFR